MTIAGFSRRLSCRLSRDYAMHFICHTALVPTFRRIFSEALTFEGDRSILLSSDEAVPEDELGACIRMALTYHL